MSIGESVKRTSRPRGGLLSLHRTEPAAFNRQVEAMRIKA